MQDKNLTQRFTNKIAVITASSTGIGLAISKRLAREGATVIINSRNQQNVDKAVNEIRQLGGKADGIVVHAGSVSDRKKLLDFVQEKYGGIDILIPNAAVNPVTKRDLLITTESQMNKMYEVNFKGTFFLIKEALPLMKGRPGANVIVIGTASVFHIFRMVAFYRISKIMMNVGIKLIAKELQDEGIRVNCILPGIIKSDFSKHLWEGDKEKQSKELYQMTRLGIPDDVANYAAFIASDEASFINGENLLTGGDFIYGRL